MYAYALWGLQNTDLTVSEVGFGLWTISIGWWRNFTEGDRFVIRPFNSSSRRNDGPG
jgi:hypothetical protein